MQRTGRIALVLVALIAVAIVLVPAFLIQPFRPQTDATVALAYVLRRWSPLITAVLASGSVLLVGLLWRGMPSRRQRAAALLSVIPVIAAAWFARQRYFEWMFAPLPNAQYVRAHDAGWVGATDMVLTVEVNGDAVAWPVRQLAYHHLVQDVAGRVPIVATY